MAEHEYELLHGDVWWVEKSSKAVEARILSPMNRHVCDGSQHLAVAFHDDEEGLMVMKHGSEAMVSAWADKQRAALAHAGQDSMATGLSVVSFPVHEETVALLNRVAAGQHHDFLDRLRALEGTVPAGIPFPR